VLLETPVEHQDMQVVHQDTLVVPRVRQDMLEVVLQDKLVVLQDKLVVLQDMQVVLRALVLQDKVQVVHPDTPLVVVVLQDKVQVVHLDQLVHLDTLAVLLGTQQVELVLLDKPEVLQVRVVRLDMVEVELRGTLEVLLLRLDPLVVVLDTLVERLDPLLVRLDTLVVRLDTPVVRLDLLAVLREKVQVVRLDQLVLRDKQAVLQGMLAERLDKPVERSDLLGLVYRIGRVAVQELVLPVRLGMQVAPEQFVQGIALVVLVVPCLVVRLDQPCLELELLGKAVVRLDLLGLVRLVCRIGPIEVVRLDQAFQTQELVVGVGCRLRLVVVRSVVRTYLVVVQLLVVLVSLALVEVVEYQSRLVLELHLGRGSRQ
jgi:hypothetical protein